MSFWKKKSSDKKDIIDEYVTECTECKGKTYVKRIEHHPYTYIPYTVKVECTYCNGTGKIIKVIPRR